MTSDFETFIDSGAALDAAHQWAIPDHTLLNTFLADQASDTAYQRWLDDQRDDRLGDRRGER